MSFVLSRKKERKKNLIGNKSLENERNFFSEVKKKFSKTHLNDYSSFVRSVDTHTHTYLFEIEKVNCFRDFSLLTAFY